MTAPAFADPAEAARYAQYREAQIEEYGTYEAAATIMVGAVPAFHAGHPVPKSTAEREGWVESGLVRRVAPDKPDDAETVRARLAALDAEREQLQAALAAAEADTSEAVDGYDAMTVDQLKAELTERGLPVSGTKPELIARLRGADTEEA